MKEYRQDLFFHTQNDVCAYLQEQSKQGWEVAAILPAQAQHSLLAASPPQPALMLFLARVLPAVEPCACEVR